MNDLHQPFSGVSKEERLWAASVHLSALCFFVVPGIGHILGPLVIWLLKRDSSPFVDAHGKEALNFQLSVTIYSLAFVFLALFLIGIPLVLALAVYWFVFLVIAAVQANDGKAYQYPLIIRFI